MIPDPGAQPHSRLDAVRDLYARLLDCTARCVKEFSLPLLDATIRERSLTLLRIDSEEAALRNMHPCASWSGYAQAREIREYLTAIAGLDRTLTSRLSERMKAAAGELSALSRASNAVEAYTRHIRR